MLENGDQRQPVSLACMEAVDADGFLRVGCPQPEGASVLDSIARAAAPAVVKKPDNNRFRALTVADLITNATYTETFKEEESVDDCKPVFVLFARRWPTRRICSATSQDEHVVGVSYILRFADVDR